VATAAPRSLHWRKAGLCERMADIGLGCLELSRIDQRDGLL
jgi:hypothetical protein